MAAKTRTEAFYKAVRRTLDHWAASQAPRPRFAPPLDKIVSIGPPEGLPRAARIGLATQLENDYASVGVKFDRSTIEIGDGGSPDPAVDLADYINRHCPPRT